MKIAEKFLLGVLAAALCLSLAACSGDKPGDGAQPGADTAGDMPAQGTESGVGADAPELVSYQSGSGNFSLRVPEPEGGWVQGDGGNEESVVLDNQDQTLTVMVQGLPKGQDGAFDSLSSVVNFYREQALSGFGEPTPEDVPVSGSLTAQAESYSAKEDGVTAKALVVFLEGQNGYYVYTITGLEEQYDANIGAQREAVRGFAENAG